MFFRYVSDAFLIAPLISSSDVSLTVLNVRSTTETVGVGTRNAMPVSLPLISGMTRATAFAAPVVDGMILSAALRPPFQSFFEGPSTVFCVAVYECTVVIRPSATPKPSLRRTWTTGARQFVVQDAFETMWCFAGSYLSSLTPITIVMSSPLAGAEMMTFLAPAVRWPLAFSASVKRPVDSITYSTPSCFHGSAAGPSLTARHLILWPLTTRVSSSAADADDFSLETVPPNRPWVESYLSR